MSISNGKVAIIMYIVWHDICQFREIVKLLKRYCKCSHVSTNLKCQQGSCRWEWVLIYMYKQLAGSYRSNSLLFSLVVSGTCSKISFSAAFDICQCSSDSDLSIDGERMKV